jgi:hypothetical protein
MRRDHLAARHPGRDERILAGEFELRTPLIHDPATASWGGLGNRSDVTVTALPCPALPCPAPRMNPQLSMS